MAAAVLLYCAAAEPGWLPRDRLARKILQLPGSKQEPHRLYTNTSLCCAEVELSCCACRMRLLLFGPLGECCRHQQGGMCVACLGGRHPLKCGLLHLKWTGESRKITGACCDKHTLCVHLQVDRWQGVRG